MIETFPNGALNMGVDKKLFFPKLLEAQNPLSEKPSGPRSSPESLSNRGFWAEFLKHPPV